MVVSAGGRRGVVAGVCRRGGGDAAARVAAVFGCPVAVHDGFDAAALRAAMASGGGNTCRDGRAADRAGGEALAALAAAGAGAARLGCALLAAGDQGVLSVPADDRRGAGGRGAALGGERAEVAEGGLAGELPDQRFGEAGRV